MSVHDPVLATDLLSLPASRELDALVAEKVMGWTRRTDNNAISLDGTPVWIDPAVPEGTSPFRPGFRPSSDIAAAWLIVEKLSSEREHGLSKYEFTLGRCLDGCWHAEFNEYASGHDADTAPLAICRAALQAVGC